MRPELSLIVALTLGILVAAMFSQFGDYRSHYAATISIASLPLVYLIGTAVVLFVRAVLIKTAFHTLSGYVIFGAVISVALAIIVYVVGGGITATASVCTGTFVTFFAYAALISRKQYGQDA